MLVTFIMVITVNYLAFALMACAMDRHRDSIAGRRQPCLPAARQWQLRATGGVLLLFALWVAVFGEGAAFGTLLWVLLTSTAAILVVLTLTWKPCWLAWLLHCVKYWRG